MSVRRRKEGRKKRQEIVTPTSTLRQDKIIKRKIQLDITYKLLLSVEVVNNRFPFKGKERKLGKIKLYLEALIKPYITLSVI